MASRNREFLKSIAPMLESIDSILADQGKPVFHRPLEAASMFARYSLVSVEGDENKDDFFAKPWFAAVYAEIHGWYKKKYGRLLEVTRDSINGLIVYRGIPHVIAVPKTISALQDDGLVKLTFPTRIYDTEHPERWIQPKLTKSAISRGGQKLRNRIKFVCSAVRQIQTNTGGAGGKDTGVPRMASSIVEHLGNAASIASASKQENNSLALWDIHLACEKSIKALLSQRQVQYPKTHDLVKLTKLLQDQPIQRDARRLIRQMPAETLVMRHRYLQEKPLSPNQLFVPYFLALKLCVLFSSQITQKFKIGDASFFLKKPPWLSQLD